MEVSRRDLLTCGVLAAVTAALPVPALSDSTAKPADNSPPDEPIELGWLETVPAIPFGTTWGMPWPRGTCRPNTAFSLRNTVDGASMPLQTWPLAYWPDGSVKWTAHAAGPGVERITQPVLIPQASTTSTSGPTVTLRDTGDSVEVDTGIVRCRISKRGDLLFDALMRDGQIVAEKGQLICLREDVTTGDRESGGVERERYGGTVERVTVEQVGPIRAVVRVEGRHHRQEGRNGPKAWLPFVVRLYFYAGSENVRLMHSFVFDGDDSRDAVRGLGVRFAVPMKDAPHDRHVRFVGADGGVWSEAVRTLTGLRRDPGPAIRAAQIAGKATPPSASFPDTVRTRLQYIPAWSDFTLSQLSADGFQIRKRTAAGHAWIRAAAGQRAAGVGYVGGANSGGVAFGLRDFWQRCPTQLDIRGAATEKAEVTVWLWAPDSPPMDLRFYHDGMGMETHHEELEGLEITYEDYEKGWGTPYGVARSSELYLAALPQTPPPEHLLAWTGIVHRPPQLTATPARLHAAGVFGDWSLPDRSTPLRKRIEDQLDYLLAFYLEQPEQRRWYGFWDYGDVMHSYDSDRHEWRYDVGGFAWANSELSPDLWLWYSFLRTGRADVFRFAEAMTRHTGEVDVYHIGQFKGLGTRHGVQHWADSSKQPRVSNGAYRRFYYYLTADERTGDLLRELLDADQRLKTVDIGRKIRTDKGAHQTSAGFGTDWCSLAAAWLTEWERTGDARYRDRLLSGLQFIGQLPHGWLTGGAPYDPDTGHFLGKPDGVGISHLSAVFGAVEISSELLSLLDAPDYEKAWLAYCEFYNAPPEERDRIAGRHLNPKDFNLGEAHSRLTAYAAHRRNDPNLAERAWREFLGGAAGLGVMAAPTLRRIERPLVLNPVDEGPGMSTNAASQWGLAAIQNLALIGDRLPESA